MKKGINRMLLSSDDDEDDSLSDDELNEMENSFESVGSHEMDCQNSSFDNENSFSTTPQLQTPQNFLQHTPQTPLSTPLIHTPLYTPLHTPQTTPFNQTNQSQYFSPFSTLPSEISPISSTPFSTFSHYYQPTTPFTQKKPENNETNNVTMPTPDFSQLDSGFLPRKLNRVNSNTQIPDTPMKKTLIKSRLTPHHSQHPSTPLHTPNNFSTRTPHFSDAEISNYANNFIDFVSIGKGSFSEVFRAMNINDKKFYAIKVSKRPFNNAKQRDRAIKELLTVKQLNHPHLLQYIFAWENPETKTMFIQMELCEKGSLSQFLSKWIEEHHQNPTSFIKEDDLWHFLTDMILALHHIHSNHFIHLDIKPANIFIDQYNRLKIGDFGLTIKNNAEEEFTEGDSRYLAPELLEPGVAKFESDIFSLGATLLEMSALIEMPQVGTAWELLRLGNVDQIGIIPDHYSLEWKMLIGKMMNPIFSLRPSSWDILSHPKIQLILSSRFSLRSPTFNQKLNKINNKNNNNNNKNNNKNKNINKSNNRNRLNNLNNNNNEEEEEEEEGENYDRYLRRIFEKIGGFPPDLPTSLQSNSPLIIPSLSSQLFADQSHTLFFTPSSNLTLNSTNNNTSFNNNNSSNNYQFESLLNSSNSLYNNNNNNNNINNNSNNNNIINSASEMSFHNFHQQLNGKFNDNNNNCFNNSFNNSFNSSGGSVNSINSSNNSSNNSGSSAERHKRNLLSSFESASSLD